MLPSPCRAHAPRGPHRALYHQNEALKAGEPSSPSGGPSSLRRPTGWLPHCPPGTPRRGSEVVSGWQSWCPPSLPPRQTGRRASPWTYQFLPGHWCHWRGSEHLPPLLLRGALSLLEGSGEGWDSSTCSGKRANAGQPTLLRGSNVPPRRTPKAARPCGSRNTPSPWQGERKEEQPTRAGHRPEPTGSTGRF